MNKKEMTNLIIDKRNEGKEQPFIELSNRFFFQHFFFRIERRIQRNRRRGKKNFIGGERLCKYELIMKVMQLH